MFAKDGYGVIGWALFLGLVLTLTGLLLDHWVSVLVYLLAFGTVGFTLYFFRDPDRTIPADQSLLLSPADGKVIDIKKVEEHRYLKQRVTQISIFLSPLDVHVNRVPASGIIEYLEYIPGDYLVAWHEKSSELNERTEIGLLHESGIKIHFRQITGYVARRITCHIKKGDQVTAGSRFGMMKFGSRMDILVPESVEIMVKPGDRTAGGESILGRFPVVS